MAGSPPTETRFNWENHDPYIINLINGAIAAGQISLTPGGQSRTYRVAPTIAVPYNAACQTPAMVVVLGQAVIGVAPTFVAAGEHDAATGSPNITTPAGAVGDILLCGVYRTLSQTITGPAGFQRLCSSYDGNSNTRAELWFKIADGTEPGTLTWGPAGVDFWLVHAARYRGQGGTTANSTGAIIEVRQGLQQPNGNSPYVVSPPMAGPFSANSLMVFFGQLFGGNLIAAPGPTVSGGSGVVTARVDGVAGQPDFILDSVF